MLSIRLAITTLFIFTQLSVLALGFSEAGLSNLLGNSGVFSVVVTGTIVFALAFPHRHQPRWLYLSFFSAATYLAIVLLLQYLLYIPIPGLTLICGQLFSIVLICVLVCWVQNCLSEFENAVFQMGLHDPIAALDAPESEERIQSMLMNSRYTGQSIGLVSIDNPAAAQQQLKAKLIEQIQKKMASAHWHSLVVRNLRNELRLIDKFYKNEEDDKLILVCPGLSDSELTEFCQKLEKSITHKLDAESSCSYVTFPKDALTLDGLVSRLGEKSSRGTDSGTTPKIQSMLDLPDRKVVSDESDQDPVMPASKATVNGNYLE